MLTKKEAEARITLASHGFACIVNDIGDMDFMAIGSYSALEDGEGKRQIMTLTHGDPAQLPTALGAMIIKLADTIEKQYGETGKLMFYLSIIEDVKTLIEKGDGKYEEGKES